MDLKYIVTDRGAFVIFSGIQNHVDMARGVWGKPVGAGKCNIARLADSEKANVHCWGKSVSLGIESREEDEKIINKAIDYENY